MHQWIRKGQNVLILHCIDSSMKIVLEDWTDGIDVRHIEPK